MKKLTLGSLFSGSGGFEVRENIRIRFAKMVSKIVSWGLFKYTNECTLHNDKHKFLCYYHQLTSTVLLLDFAYSKNAYIKL